MVNIDESSDSSGRENSMSSSDAGSDDSEYNSDEVETYEYNSSPPTFSPMIAHPENSSGL